MFKTAEAITPMHPDKICDRISDAVLDACLAQNPMSRVAIESMGGHGQITITGELTTFASINIEEIVVDLLKNFSADEVIVKLGYAIGRAEPVMATYSMTKGEQTLSGVIDKSNYNLTPKGIIDFLELKKPQFEKITEWG